MVKLFALQNEECTVFISWISWNMCLNSSKIHVTLTRLNDILARMTLWPGIFCPESYFGQSNLLARDTLARDTLAGETVWPVSLWLVTFWPMTLWPE